MKTQSSEIQRVSEEKCRNEQRHIDYLARSAIYRYEQGNTNGKGGEKQSRKRVR